MITRTGSIENDVPFFPYRLSKSEDNADYITSNHLMSSQIHLNLQAAQVLRFADGVNSLSEIIEKFVKLYPDAGGTSTIGKKIIRLLNQLTKLKLIWWRKVPIKPIIINHPTTIFWEITAACNLRCLHCVANAGNEEVGELSVERCMSLAEELAKFGVKNIAFSGGEPLLHPSFFSIAQKIRSLGMTIQLSTNGTLVTKKVALHLKELDAQVQVSLDGSKPEIHEILRPRRNAFARTIKGVRELVAAGHKITVGTVLSTINFKDIHNIIDLAKRLGVATFRLIPFIPAGRGQLHKKMVVSPSKVKQITKNLIKLRETGLDIAPLEFEETLVRDENYTPQNENRNLKCDGAVAYATITPTGEVLPCRFFDGVRTENVKSLPFRDIWYQSRFLNYFRSLRVSDLHGNCAKCRWLFRCAGSCRAFSFAEGDLFNGNKSCWAWLENENSE